MGIQYTLIVVNHIIAVSTLQSGHITAIVSSQFKGINLTSTMVHMYKARDKYYLKVEAGYALN